MTEKQESPLIVYVSLLLTAALFGACGGDDGREQKCGNGVVDVDEFETCDGDNLNYRTCLDIQGFSGGTLRCGADCRFDTSGCINTCGDGQVDAGEACDGGNLNGRTCRDLGFSGGGLACGMFCEFDTSSCIDLCGNDALDEQEECDGSNLGGLSCKDFGYDEGTLGCTGGCFFDTTNCKGNNCGNEEIDSGEECDGPNLNLTNCEDLGFGGGTLLCTPICTFNTSNCIDLCGNNVLDPGEACDGINLNFMTCQALGFSGGDLACTGACEFDTQNCESGDLCGNDQIDADEDCDGVDLGGLACEDLGWTGGTLACDEFCRFDASACEGTDPCGNGTIEAGEDCDTDDLAGMTCEGLGYFTGDLACSWDCSFDTWMCTNCGNAAIDAGEECDGSDLAQTTCLDLGYDGGDLACGPECSFDISGCTGCTDDSYEENDDQGGAASVPAGYYTDLVLCNPGGGEEDWFSVDLTAGATLMVLVEFDTSLLDIDMKLLDSSGGELDASGTSSNQETIIYTSADAQTGFIQIFPYADATGVVSYSMFLNPDVECQDHVDCPSGQLCQDYTCVDFVCDDENPCPDGLVCDAGLCVECITAADCPDPVTYACQDNICVVDCIEDPYEPNSTSDQAAAVAVDAPQRGLTLCGESDEDWFLVDLTEMGQYNFDFRFTHASGDIDVNLYASDDPLSSLASGTSVNDNETFNHAVPGGASGSYLIKVKLFGLGVVSQTYDMVVEHEGTAECFTNDDCPPGELCVDNTCVASSVGDSCADPIVVSALPYNTTDVDIMAYSNQLEFEDTTCTGYGSGGKDVVYRVTLGSGQVLSAALYSTYDGAIYIVDDCSAQPMPAASCLDGADAVTADDTETVGYTATGAGDVYVVVDQYQPDGPSSGTFTLDITVQ